MVTIASTIESPSRVVLEDAVQVSSLSGVQCVARADLTVTGEVTRCELEVGGRFNATQAGIYDSRVRLCAGSEVGEVHASRASASTLHLFAMAGPWYDVRGRAGSALPVKEQMLLQYQSDLARLGGKGNALSHTERERVTEAQFALPGLEAEIKELRKKITKLESTIEQRRSHRVGFPKGLHPGVEFRFAEAKEGFLVAERIEGPVTLKYAGGGTAVFTGEGQSEMPFGQHEAIREIPWRELEARIGIH